MMFLIAYTVSVKSKLAQSKNNYLRGPTECCKGEATNKQINKDRMTFEFEM